MKVVAICGRSSVGKDSICRELLKRIPGAKLLVTYTTRPKRIGEVEGVDYVYITEEELNQFRKAGSVIEERVYHTVFGDRYYCTVYDDQFKDAEEKGVMVVVASLNQLISLQRYLGYSNVISVYIELDDKTLLERSIERESRQQNPNYKEICRRFMDESGEYNDRNKAVAMVGWDNTFYNTGSLDDTVDKVLEYIQARL